MTEVHMDINCDLGEGAGNDAAIMPFISSANIACGFHAGDSETMAQTIRLAKQFNVSVGAHPSYDDKGHFGRMNMQLSPDEIYELIYVQLNTIAPLCANEKVLLHHVKPHGALYNQAASSKKISTAIAAAIKTFDQALIVYGLSGSYLISEAAAAGLRVASEVFMDRTYRSDGSLTPRSEPGALIDTPGPALSQALTLASEQKVITTDGKLVRLRAETICIHGDGPNAVLFAKALYDTFRQHHIIIGPPA